MFDFIGVAQADEVIMQSLLELSNPSCLTWPTYGSNLSLLI